MLKSLAAFLFCATFATGAMARLVAGGVVEIDQPVDGNLYVAGGNVTLNAPVGGNARIAGGDVNVKGQVAGRLSVAGGHVKIDAPVGGNATVSGGSLELGPNARINGRLDFRGGHLEQDEAAQVVGGVTRISRHRRGWDGDDFPFRGRWIVAAVWTAGLMVLAALIAGALPGPVRRMQDELRSRPWLAALLGVVALIGIPIAAVIVMITIVGIPVGLLALVGYAALLLVGYVAASIVISGLLLDRYKPQAGAHAGWRIGAAVLAVLVIATLARIPVVGGFIGLAALVVGVGVIVGAVLHRKGTPTATATA